MKKLKIEAVGSWPSPATTLEVGAEGVFWVRGELPLVEWADFALSKRQCRAIAKRLLKFADAKGKK